MGIAPILTNWAFWWISDDKFIGIPNSFQAIEWLEIRKWPKKVSLQNALEKVSWTVVVDKINCALTVFSTWDILAFGNAGNIYRVHSGTWKKIYTHSWADPILGCAEMNGYIYRATATKLHRTTIASIGDPLTPTNLNRQTFTAGNTNAHPMLVDSKNTIYIGDWKYVATVDTAAVFTPAALTVYSLDEIYDITYNNSYFRFYTRQGGKDYGMLYFRDWVASAPSQIKELTGQYRCVATKDDVDYVILGLDPILYYYPFQKQAIKRIPSLSNNLNTMIVYKNYLTFWTPGWIYTWGNFHKDYPEVLNVEYKTSNGNNTDEICCIWNSQWDLYVAWKNWTSYGVDKLSTTAYALTWFFITKVYYWSEMWRNKNCQELYVTHKPLITGQTIQVYFQKDLAWWYILQTTLTPTTSSWTNTKITLPAQFNELEVKVVLNWPGTSTPEIYETVLRFDQQEDGQ